MDLFEAIKSRHSVRSYTDKKIGGTVEMALRETIAQCNSESGLNIQLCMNEPNAFAGKMAHYGKFENVNNYIAIIGKKDKNLQEKSGYYGEKIVLKATQLGLNSCWVALTYSKGKSVCTVKNGEKLVCVISLGYGTTNGVNRKTKSIYELSSVDGATPDWFKRGMGAVQLAPTATNQQKFLFELSDSSVTAKAFPGFYSKLDLGIAKYHFEIGSGKSIY